MYSARLASPRLVYLVLSAVTIAAGLAVHLKGTWLPPAARDILGDALWATLIFWLSGFAFPRAAILVRAVGALAVCFTVEFSQLVHADWLDGIRRTLAGHLLLGSGFDPRDLLSYSAGIVAGSLVELAGKRPPNGAPTAPR